METNLDDIRHIRSMMERSSKFLSISGISGVLAGVFATVGAFMAYLVLIKEFSITGSILYDFIIIAVGVLIFAISGGLLFSARKAKMNNAKLWTPITLQIALDFLIPLGVGGLFCLILIYKHVAYMVAPCMLIFYGLSLVAVGSRTYGDVKYLGILEIILGLAAAVVVGYDLVFWGIGFGLLHIIYGVVMYYKYDMKSGKNG
ncbi:MAG: hypothetical protein E6767_12995 [Dysgonomonas sp.]|nr:hypothetical protein [Dysgonomonas sp.]